MVTVRALGFTGDRAECSPPAHRRRPHRGHAGTRDISSAPLQRHLYDELMAFRHVVTLSVLGVAATAFFACSAKPEAGATSGPPAAMNCNAEMVWLQKNAYSN